MKVLQLGKFYPISGGVEKVMYDIVVGLSKRDFHSDMLCASLDNKLRKIPINEKAKIICTPTLIKMCATMFSPKMISKLRSIMDEYDIIHVHHPDPMAALALWFSGYKGKVVLHWHSDILRQRIALKFFMPLQNWLVNRADVIVGTTPLYLAESPFLQSKLLRKVCIPIGVPPMSPQPLAVNDLKMRYHGKKIIFSLGRLVTYKGFEYLIKAASFLSDDYVILIGGSGPLKQSLQDIIAFNDLQNKVFLLGRISDGDLPNYFGACDLYIMSSIWKTEAFGIVQIEAMSCGKPIVATKIKGSGVSWVNEDGVSGINVEPMDSEAIAKAAVDILSDREQYMKYSKGAKERYYSIFTYEKMIDNCINIYQSII